MGQKQQLGLKTIDETFANDKCTEISNFFHVKWCRVKREFRKDSGSGRATKLSVSH